MKIRMRMMILVKCYDNNNDNDENDNNDAPSEYHRLCDQVIMITRTRPGVD